MTNLFPAALTFNDIFKSSFLEKVSSFSLLDVIVAMALSFVIGLFIFAVYKKTFQGVMYSASFGVSLMAMALITTLIILAVTSNVILSLGMVGALSIVRFRTAVKEPLDIAFLFWSISAGIVTGAGLLPLAVVGSLLVGVVIILFANRKISDTPYILVISMEDDQNESSIMSYIQQNTKKHLVKSKGISPSGVELTVEIRLQNQGTSLVNELSHMDGVANTALVSFNGEYMS